MAAHSDPPSPASPFEIDGDMLRAQVRLTPKGSRNSVNSLATGSSGEGYLKASVTAVAENGKANKALLKLLAKEWGVAKTSLKIVRGVKERRKVIEISGDAAKVRPQLEKWLQKFTEGKPEENNDRSQKN